MFILDLSKTTTLAVNLHYAVDHETVETVAMVLKVNRLNEQQFDEFLKNDTLDMRDFCKANVIGWSGLKDGDKEVAFTPEGLHCLVNQPGIALQIFRAMKSDYKRALEKN